MGWACLNIRTKERDRLDQVVRRVKEVAMSSGALSTTRRSARSMSPTSGTTRSSSLRGIMTGCSVTGELEGLMNTSFSLRFLLSRFADTIQHHLCQVLILEEGEDLDHLDQGGKEQ